MLSNIDRKLLKILLVPDGRISSKSIARKLGVPATTVQRHRRMLEKEVLTLNYMLDLGNSAGTRLTFLSPQRAARRI